MLKNMDDVLMGAPTLETLEVMITEFLLSCQAKNIKLKPSKFFISTCVEFGGCRISADRLRDKGFIFIKPKEGRVRAFSELKRPSTKREAQVWAGMVSSLSAWAPAVNVACPLIWKATAGPAKLHGLRLWRGNTRRYGA